MPRKKPMGKYPGGQLIAEGPCPKCDRENLRVQTTKYAAEYDGGPNKLYEFCNRKSGCGYRAFLGPDESAALVENWEKQNHGHQAGIETDAAAGGEGGADTTDAKTETDTNTAAVDEMSQRIDDAGTDTAAIDDAAAERLWFDD